MSDTQVPVRTKNQYKTIPEIFASSTMTPDERSIMRKWNTQFTFYTFLSVPFVIWATRTMTLPKTQYNNVFLRGFFLRYRPWGGLNRFSGFIISFSMIMFVFSSIQLYTSHNQFKQLVSLDTPMAKELRNHFYQVNPQYYKQIVPDSIKKLDAQERGETL